MEIRKLEVTEHQECRRLYEEVFAEDSPSFVDYYYTEKTRDNQIYTVIEDGEIRSLPSLCEREREGCELYRCCCDAKGVS